MGLGPSKEKLIRILEKSSEKINSSDKIEYECKQNDDLETIEEKKENLVEYNKKEVIKNIDSPLLDIKDVNKFPYNSIGFISVKFQSSIENYFYTCFAIYKNVVITLASNLIDDNKGGKAISILTSFSNENILWDNVYIQNKTENLENDLKTRLAAIIYENDICNEWIGVEGGKKEDFFDKNIYTIFSLGLQKADNKFQQKDEVIDVKAEPYLREIEIKNENPFKEANNSNRKEIVKKTNGSPCYYKDNKNGVYVIAIINKLYEFQYFDKNDMIFLNDMVNKGQIIRKVINKGIDEDNIRKLDLSRNDYGPLDIKYLTDFKLNNLKILDLSSNSIKAQGAFYLSMGNFKNLESLNLNFNEIGNEGVNHLSNSFLPKLSYLYLFHCKISAEGINYLIKANFIDNLIILSLSDNKIGDLGVRILTEHKGWNKLNTLNLNANRITDISLGYLKEATMPALKKLNILRNKFTENAKPIINELRKNNHIHVSYRTQAERMKEYKQKIKEKNSSDNTLENEKETKEIKKEIKERDNLDNPTLKTEETKKINNNDKYKFNRLNSYLNY